LILPDLILEFGPVEGLKRVKLWRKVEYMATLKEYWDLNIISFLKKVVLHLLNLFLLWLR